MAQQKDLLTRLADAGEEAIQRLGKAPGGENMLKALNTTRERIDELQKKVRGIDALEKRVGALEKKVDALTKSRSAPARKPAARKKSPGTAKPPGTRST